MNHEILREGDDDEKEAFRLFAEQKFPTYEVFWNKFVFSLTQRPQDISFKDDALLQKDFPKETITLIHERICIAQLHYSALKFMLSAYKNIDKTAKDIELFEYVFSCLFSALDVSAELCARYERLKMGVSSLDAFDPEAVYDGKKLREKFTRKFKYPQNIQEIREYRNNLIHGRMSFYAKTPTAGFLSLPSVGKEKYFLDWRKAFSYFKQGKTGDFEHSKNIAQKSFDNVIHYLDDLWQKFLI